MAQPLAKLYVGRRSSSILRLVALGVPDVDATESKQPPSSRREGDAATQEGGRNGAAAQRARLPISEPQRS